MKKIYFTVTNDLTYDQRMIRICSTLVKDGYNVCLVGRKRPGSEALKNRSFQQKRLKCIFNKGKMFYIEYNIRLFFFLLFRQFDAVCSIDLDSILAGYYSSKLKRKICIYDAHEFFTELPEVVERPKVKRTWEWIGKKTVPKLKYCYTVCESLKKVFKDQYNVDFSVIRNVPLQQDKNITPLPFHPPYILLYQGVLNDGRGLEEMIEAIQHLEDVEFWLVGEGDNSEKLRNLSKALNLTDKVKFLGYAQPDQLLEVTKRAHIGINLLQNKGLNYYYSLANKFFDYIQAQKPSLNMNFPEYSNIISEFPVGLLLEDLSTESIVVAIEKFTKSSEFYTQIQKNCVRAREEFIWEKEELKLLEFYNRIFEKK